MNKKQIIASIIDKISKKEVTQATNEFARRVTENNGMGKEERALWIDAIFSEEATLRPTVGQVIRTKNSTPTNIQAYFRDYFSRSVIPGLKVVNLNYQVIKIQKNLYANYAYVKFDQEDGDKLTAVMSFIWKKNKNNNQWKILLLHSQPIHLEVPTALVNQGDIFPYWKLSKPYGNL